MTFRALALIAIAALALPAHADALLDQVLAGARVAKPQSFERTAVLVASNDKGSTTINRVQRFNAAAPAGKQWTLVSENGAPPSAKATEEFTKSINKVPAPGYYRIATFLGAGAIRLADSGGKAVYRITKLPKGSVNGGGFDLSDRLSADLTVDPATATVTRTRIFLPKPTRIMLVAKLDKFDAVTDYAPVPGSAPRITTQSSEITGDNPMQGAGTQKQNFTYRPL
ncbi:hypothetical protein [Sandaracinobacteroides saxicola]|uniref:Uncharacterized protein n=1 Tax=Sandaracinobacteroides saxicola TaxID=2759707 RepID=A0A7G5IDU9_9SPHN|nr:hypothetical protein [Sandaracinobacteroides saxicola]QMW21541.1 hypothetical protein H3309_08890 [Sandaracinobacteroides saxicola]